MKNISNSENEKRGELRLLKVLPEKYDEKFMEEKGRLLVDATNELVEMQFYLNQKSDSNGMTEQDPSHFVDPIQSHLIYFLGFKGSIAYSPIADTGTSRLDIRFNLAFLETMIGEDCPETLQLLAENSNNGNESGERGHHITPQMKIIINELLLCDRSGKMKQLFQFSKILELVMLQIDQIEEAEKPLQNIKAYDIGKFQEAKSIVEDNLASPYSLKKLAHKVGLNDFKLKRGFKELYGFTVFGYLRELRMQKARTLLLTEKESVTDVSAEVGYQHPHHFSAAFKKRFGILPGSLKK